jgi:hypothetical protein
MGSGKMNPAMVMALIFGIPGILMGIAVIVSIIIDIARARRLR